MASYIEFTFPDTFHNNHIDEIQFTVTVDASPLDLTGASIALWAQHQTNDKVVKYSSPKNIEITTPASGIFKFKEQIITMEPGVYDYDIEIKLADGTRKTYVTGTWTIIDSITSQK